MTSTRASLIGAVSALVPFGGLLRQAVHVQTRARFEPTWELMEYICQENNTNVGHITQ